MVSMPQQSNTGPSPLLIHDAAVIVGRDGAAADAAVTHIGLRSLRIHGLDSLQSAQMLWVDVDLGSVGSVRPLAEVVRRDGDRTDVRFRHVFPDDQRRLEAYFRANATPSGY